MIKQWLNYRTVLALVAVCIVVGTIFYSNHLSKKIATDEKQKVIAWVEAQQTIAKASDSSSLNLASIISTGNTDIPIIETDEQDHINPFGTKNLDTNLIHKDTNYLKQQLALFKQQNEPILVVINEKPYMANKYYYGESELQKEVRYYPIVQLVVVALFIVILFIAQRISYLSTQTQLWAGMAKETAHQLGTPVSSLQGWLEMMKEMPGNEKIVPEMEKDVQRLQLISDRFGKIGSQPQLEERNVVQQVSYMMDYIKKRAGGKVQFILNSQGQDDIIGMVSPPLFDWVMENLLKNALDAMDGKGSITVSIQDNASQISIDVTDTGKGITKANINKVFKPGFSTKKRGWGLGLTLTKRIVEQYHKGQIFVTQSEVGKGTTFRIILPK